MKMKNNKQNKYSSLYARQDILWSNVIIWLIIGLLLTNFFSMYFLGLSRYISLISKVILVLLIIRCIWFFSLKINDIMLGLYCFFILCFGVSYIVVLEKTGYYYVLSEFIINILLTTYVMFRIKDFSYLLLRLLDVSKVLILIVAIIIITVASSDTYSMGLANSMIIPIIMLIWGYYKEHKLDYLFIAAIGVIAIILKGSRGALLPIAIYFLIKLIRDYNNGKTHPISFFISVAMMLLIIFKGPIFRFIYRLLESIGIYSRTLYLLASNNVGHSSSREAIYETIFSEIMNNPFCIRGIGIEYVIAGIYPHNIILEILIQFGVIFGGVMIIIFLYFVINTLTDKSNTYFSEIKLIMMCSSVPVLFVSGSFWRNIYFWIWIVLCIHKKNNFNGIKKTKRNYTSKEIKYEQRS